MKYNILLLFLLQTMPVGLMAQYYETGQDPAHIRWRQINTSNFQIIYPDDFESQAQRVAYLFEQVYDYAAKNLKESPRKISVVLHTHTVTSNGMVAWAPKRVELFTTPNQKIYSQDWLEQLATHEFSHVLQMDRIQQELPPLLLVLFGEQLTAAIVGLYLPFWFLEGEAVCNETAFSNAGRGRLPSFLMENKALLLEKGSYSLSKMYLGSYKEYIPDHYSLGYWLTGKIKEKYGVDIWKNTKNYVAHNPFTLSPVNTELKAQTGLGLNELYINAYKELQTEWLLQQKNIQPKVYEQVSPPKKSYTNYTMGHQYNGKIYAIRTAMDDITRIVCLDSMKNESVVHTPGYLLRESFSGTKNLLIWSENQSNLRWEHSSVSVIKVFDVNTNKLRKIRTENNVFAPCISPNQQFYAAVEVDRSNQHFLSVFDLKTGKRLLKYTTPDNQFLFTPCWNENSDQLFFIALNKNGKYLASLKWGDKTLKSIGKIAFDNIKNPCYADGKIYFIGSYTGVDNVYSIDIEDENLRRLSSVKFGADYPLLSENGKSILFSNYSSDGFSLNRMKNTHESGLPGVLIPELKYPLAEKLSEQTKQKIDFQMPDSIHYPSKNYCKMGHIFNFHSWSPFYFNTEEYEIRPGFSLLSQNELGTSTVHVGYDYNSTEETGKFVGGIRYAGWFPVLKVDGEYGKRASQYYQITQHVNQQGQVVSQDTTLKRFTWKEQNLKVNINVPLVLSSGKYSRLFQPEVEYELTNIAHDNTSPEQFFSGNYQTLSYRLYFHNLLHTSKQALQPRWGQIFDFTYRHSPWGNINFGELTATQVYFYLPGIWKNQGIRFYNGYQEKKLKTQSSFSNSVRIPRGYMGVQNTRFYSSAIDYRLPIACPDWTIGKWAYIKRIKASLFYDYGNFLSPVFSNNGNYIYSAEKSMSSIGVELQSDLHVFRFFAPIEVGIRNTYRPDFQDLQFELLFSIDFSGL